MAVTAQASGTQAAAVGSEHTLADVAVAGTFTLHVDAGAMAAGDTLELRIYQIVLAGGSRQLAYLASFAGAQDGSSNDLAPVKISVPVSNELTDAGSLRCTLKQTAGTGRSYPWKLVRYG
jgi:hypothetical protein